MSNCVTVNCGHGTTVAACLATSRLRKRFEILSAVDADLIMKALIQECM